MIIRKYSKDILRIPLVYDILCCMYIGILEDRYLLSTLLTRIILLIFLNTKKIRSGTLSSSAPSSIQIMIFFVFFTLGAIGTFTIGAAIAAGRVSYGKLVSEPAIWATVIAVALLWFELSVPK